jgi:hypothetical protein
LPSERQNATLLEQPAIGVEKIRLATLGGADSVTVGDPNGTGARRWQCCSRVESPGWRRLREAPST